MRLLRSFSRDERGALAGDAVKAAIAIGFLSLIGVHMMGNRIDGQEKDRLAGLSYVAAKGKQVDPRQIDPMSVGSIARAADATRLDPCALPPPAR